MNGAEKNTKKKVRISIIDVLIILTVIACIAATFVHYKIYEKENAADNCRLVIYPDKPHYFDKKVTFSELKKMRGE